MAISIGPTIGIEGEKEFRDALRNIIQQCKTLASESDRVSTAFKKNTDAISAFKDQSDALQQQLAKQSQRVEQLYQMYEQCSDIYGELDTRTLKWKQALNQAETEADGIRSKISDLNVELEKDAVTTATKNVESLQAEYDRITTSADNWGNSTTEVEVQQEALSKVIVAQKDKIDALNDLYKTASKQLGRNSDDLIEYETAISKARKELDNLEKSLSEIPKKLAISDFNDAAGKVDGLKQEYDAITNSVGLYRTAAEKATAQQENLSKQIEAQKDKVDALYRVYETCADSLGRTDSETLKWKATLGQAESELTQMENALSRVNLELKKSNLETQGKRVSVVTAEYEKASTALEKHKGALQQNANQHEILGRAVEAQKDKIKVLNDVYYEAQNALDRNEDELLEWRTAILNAETELDNLQWQLKELPSQLQLVGDKCSQIGGTLTSVGTGLTAAVTTPIVALGTKAVTTYGDVDKVFRQVKATIGEDNGTVEEFNHLWDVMMDEATESVYDVQDAADALLNYAQAGFSATECADMLHGAFALAAGTGTEMTTVTAGMSVALKAFNADSSEASHYADVFARGQAQAKVTTTDLIDSLSYAAPVFNSLGYSVEDLVAAVGMMGDAGYTGSEAGAALRTGLMRLAAPTEKASDLMVELGLSASDVDEMFDETEGSLEDCSATMEEFGLSSQTIFDAEGNIRPMVDIIENLSQAFDGLTQQEKMDALDKIFGKNRGAAWLSMIEQGSEKFERLESNLENCTGDADEMADALMSGVGGSLEKLSSDFDVFINTLGETLGPTAEKITGALSGLMDWFLSLSDEEQNQIVQVGMVVAVIGPALVAIGKVVSAIGVITSGLGQLGTAIGGVIDFIKAGGIASAITKITNAFKGIGTAITGGGIMTTIAGIGTAIAGVALAVSNFIEMFQNGFSWLNEALMLVGVALAGVAAVILGAPALVAGVVAGIVAAVATAVILIKDHWTEIKEFFSDLWDRIKEKASDAWQGICDFVVDIKDSIVEKWEEFKNGMSDIWTGIKETASDAWQGICDKSNSAKDSVVSHWNDFTTKASEFFSPVVEMMKENWDSFANFFSAIGDFISAVLGGIWDIISALCELGFAAISSALSDFWEAASSYLSERINAVQDVLADFWDGVTSYLSERITAIQETLAEFWEGVITYLSERITSIQENLTQFWEWIKEQFTPFVDWIKEQINAFFSWINEEVLPLIEEIKTWCSEQWEQLCTDLGELLEDIKTTIKEQVENVKKIVIDTVQGLFDKLGEFLDKAHTWGMDLVNNMAAGIREAASNIRDAASNIADNIRSYIHFSEPDEGPLSDFHTYMPDMMSQLAEGMLDNRMIVSNAALTVAGDIAGNIQPTTTTNNTNVGGVTIVVNGADGQDVNELADIVMEKINNQFVRTRVAFG